MIRTAERHPGEGGLGDSRSMEDARSDDQLMADLAAGQQEALQVLHRRHAALVFHIACRSLDAPAAEEITQDVFLRVWQKASSFDPARGSFRTWILQIAHYRVLNELRHRGRRPKAEGDSEESLVNLSAHDPGPEEQLWSEYKRSTIQRALAALPEAQGQALRLAFFQDLTHEQVANFLEVPLGTAKGRIRMALEKLNTPLAALVATLVAAVGLSIYGWNRYRSSFGQDERALAMLTSSHMESLRLVPSGPLGDVEHGPHATYRAERGGSIAVFTLSNLPGLHAPETYRLWRFSGGAWQLLGEPTVDAQGHGRLLLEVRDAHWPEVLTLTREDLGPHGPTPGGAVVLSWPAPGTPATGVAP